MRSRTVENALVAGTETASLVYNNSHRLRSRHRERGRDAAEWTQVRYDYRTTRYEFATTRQRESYQIRNHDNDFPFIFSPASSPQSEFVYIAEHIGVGRRQWNDEICCAH